MNFVWPQMLWLLAALPALVAAYVLILRRRTERAVPYASVALVKEAVAGRRFRRHIPPLVLLLATAALLLATARPSARITLPSQHQTIVLAIDVSLSMRATDVEPNRIVAAQAAAKSFIEEAPRDVRIAVVSFAGSSALVQKPTDDRDELLAAIDRLQLQYGTATGAGVLQSLATLFPEDEIDIEAATFGSGWMHSSRAAAPIDRERKPEKKRAAVPPGSYPSGAIILLSDGRRTTGPDPMAAARMAADRGVRIYTVGFGTVDGGTAGFGMGGWGMYLRLDEETLRAIADVTRGEYFYAGTAADLKKVYQTLGSKLVLEKKETELTFLFSALGALLAATAAALSVSWFGRFA